RISKEGSAWLLKVFWDNVLGKVDRRRRETISLAPSYLTSHNCVLCTLSRFVTEADPVMAK
ncbi:hypothetical protein JMJ77_0008743, partial [Colletotrichum scovillei]